MNAAETLARRALPTRQIRYSNEDFDCAQRIANELTDIDRKAQKHGTPAYGYSNENYALAAAAIRAWLRN
jgi:hypothetical protein